MGVAYKTLGQSAPAATTQTTLYTVPAATQTVVSTLAICNRGNTAPFNVAVIPNGQSLSNANYIIYQNYVNQYDTVFLTLGIAMASGDQISVLANSNTLSFSAFGSETS